MKRHQNVGDSTWVCVADKTDEVIVSAVASVKETLGMLSVCDVLKFLLGIGVLQ